MCFLLFLSLVCIFYIFFSEWTTYVKTVLKLLYNYIID